MSMGKVGKRLGMMVFAALLAAGCAGGNPLQTTPIDAATHSASVLCIPENAVQETAKVTDVVDGDTIKVEMDGETYRVRYIGIDTPETVKPDTPVQFFGPEASAANKKLVDGKTITMVKDVSETDTYGRLLRYVIVDGMFVNYELVAGGYANAVTYPPDVACSQTFRDAERAAREAEAGLWGATPTP